MKIATLTAILAIGALLGLVPVYAAQAPQEAPAAMVVATSAVTIQDSTAGIQKPLEPTLKQRQTPVGQSCPGWLDLARQVGWPEKQLPMVAAVIYFESRCLADIKGDHSKSYSLMQVHTSSWCKPNRYWPDGYLQAKGILDTCDELLNPETNLRAGLEIWRVGGWKQWTTNKLASTTLGQ